MPQEILVSIPTETEDHVLEARYRLPQPKTPAISSITTPLFLVFAHPWGSLGGNLHNNVVTELYEYFHETYGFGVLRFNFSGVGRSSGRGSWTGVREQRDARSVIKFIQSISPSAKIVIVGYSYGSMITSSIATEFPGTVIAVAAISYPLSVAWALSLFNAGKFLAPLQTENALPKFFITGTRDQFTSANKLVKSVQTMTEPKKMVVLEAMDHFWFEHEMKIVGELEKWLLKDVLAKN